MNSDERGYVTVEHAIGFLAVTVVIGVIVAAAQAGMTGASLCQAVREGARAASIGAADPQGVASAAYPPGSYAVARSGGWVSVTGTAPYHGAAGWVGGVARCSVTTIDGGDLPGGVSGQSGAQPGLEVGLSRMGVPVNVPARKVPGLSIPWDSLSWPRRSPWSSAGSASPTASGCACRLSPTWRPWLGQGSRPRLAGRTWGGGRARQPPRSLQRMARVFSPARSAISTAWWSSRSQSESLVFQRM